MTGSDTTGGDVLRFPEGFIWGTATASYQVEGAVDAGGRGPSIWDTFSHTPGNVLGGDTGDVADDHYHRYREDVGLLAELGCTHYRFSLAWPRLQPDGRGGLNEQGLGFYERLIDELLDHDIQPFVTLYHWDLPQALEDAGGWPARDTAQRFAEYASLVHERLHDRVRYWTTLNEPWCAAFLGYSAGRHAPGRTDPAAAVRAAHHLLLGHGLAVQAMRDTARDSRIGITLNLYPVDPATASADDARAARRIDGQMNRLFLDPVLDGRYPDDVLDDIAGVTDRAHIVDGDLRVIGAPLDVLGINYYTRHVVRADPDADPVTPAPSEWVAAADIEFVERGLPTTAMGWEIDPQGLYDVLTRVTRDYDAPPLLVTENGAALPDRIAADGQVHDAVRVDFLDRHFRAALRAIDDGVDLRGYFVWSLLDNFEWSFGYARRFGLIHVDYDTQVRTPKDSARWYARVITRGGVPADG